MNKTAIKNFAIWARNKLISDINYRAGLLGIAADGIHPALPQSTGQTQFYDIGTAEPYAITGEQILQRQHLVDLLRQKEKESDYRTAYKYVLEEVAYTWFNRLIAVRFMEVNDYLPSHIRVLSSESGKMEPDLVTTPFDADLEFTRDEKQTILVLKNANKLDELFRLLFIKQCNTLNKILPALFEKTSDYTELLLNLSVIDQDGVIWHLVHDIPESDFNVEEGGQVEIIGWLYQYYNTEPKNEAFSKKGKITKDEVPAVTQLFTPDWIVRYMVENSLGRLWVEGHPNEELKSNWKYYLEEAEQEPEVAVHLNEIRKEYAKLNPENIKVIDPCMGSGHILVYAFDVLMQIYESAGYGQRDAARSILENNIYGLDIDDRAFQMAYFAVMMKARQYNRRILNGEYRPNVFSIQESNGINRNQLKYFGKGLNELEKNNAINQMTGLLDAFVDAKEYGSILNVDSCDWDLLIQFVESIDEPEQMDLDLAGISETQDRLMNIVCQGKLLEQKYEVVATNPPYMGSGNMPEKLSTHAKKNYPLTKIDLFAMFIQRCHVFLKSYGFQAMITMHAWMFISSYSKFREKLLATQTVMSLIHLGARAFEELSGEVVQTVAFILSDKSYGYNARCLRLVEEVNAYEKEKAFLGEHKEFVLNEEELQKIPGVQFAYWALPVIFDTFANEKAAIEYADFKHGMSTSDNNRFLRLWFEVSMDALKLDAHSKEDTITKKWYPYLKGGSFRRWYGNYYYVVNWQNDGKEIKDISNIKYPYLKGNLDFVLGGQKYFFTPGYTWSEMGSGSFGLRKFYHGCLFDVKGSSFFSHREDVGDYLMGLFNSNIFAYYKSILCPSLDYHSGDVARMPVIIRPDIKDIVVKIVRENVELSKSDWDSYETSWDFKKHPLVKGKTVKEAFNTWKTKCDDRVKQLVENEKKINELLIEEYGLNDYLIPDIAVDDVSISGADRKRDIQSLLSYAVGCMFGRYSVDHEGILYAGGEWKLGQFKSFTPDEDNIIPVTDEEYLEDDIVSRLCKWLKDTYGEETLEENLDFIADSLSSKGDTSRSIIRNYFVNNFFKDHCNSFSITGSGKRPIYWLFDSGKQNGFKALIYLHRYNADTIGNLRIDYLHRMQRIYESEINRMQDMIDHSASARETAQATKRREKLTKQLKECREYDEKLAHLALSRIELDLDDGVKVNYRKLQTASDGKFYEVLADSKNIMSKK